MPARLCPTCGKELVLRKSRYGSFWGCSGYPGCKQKPIAASAESESRTTIQSVAQEIVPATAPTFPPSEEQSAALALFGSDMPDVDLELVAGAGTGKTTLLALLTWYLYRTRESMTIGAFAFNKAIATELKGRLSPNTDSRSTHSYGKMCVDAIHAGDGNRGKARVDQNKNDHILDKYLPMPRFSQSMTPAERAERNEIRSKRAVIKTFVGHLKSLALDSDEVSYEVLEQIIKTHGIDIPDWISLSQIRIVAAKVLDDSETTSVIDFDDMLWIPALHMKRVMLGLRNKYEFPEYDVVLGDEAQDWNLCQHYLMMLAAGYARKGKVGRIVYVGDPLQAIYGFRGADFHSMQNFKSMLEHRGRTVRSLPLMLTRRCPKAIVKLANQVAPALTALPDAPEGEIEVITNLPWDQIKEAPHDWMISCRTNAPLISLAYEFIERRIPVHIQGREFGESLLTMIETSGADTCEQLAGYAQDKSGRESLKESPNLILLDKLDCLIKLANSLDNVDQIIKTIQELFNDADQGVLLTSIHKCKGLERRFVVCFPPHPPHMMAIKTGSKMAIEQEDHLWYVQVTRTKEKLFIIMDEKIAYKFSL